MKDYNEAFELNLSKNIFQKSKIKYHQQPNLSSESFLHTHARQRIKNDLQPPKIERQKSALAGVSSHISLGSLTGASARGEQQHGAGGQHGRRAPRRWRD